MSLRQRFRDLPDNLRLAGLSAWRGRERGLAVVAGVFLASLVITTVLAYGVGLSQIFFAESLENEPFDAKIEFSDKPGNNVSGRTNDTQVMLDVCSELMDRPEISDCSLVFGRQGIHGTGFFNQDFLAAQPLEIRSVTSANGTWENYDGMYPELLDSGPPISNRRSVRLLGPGAFDGELAERLSKNIINGEGSWPTPEQAKSKRAVIIPASVANLANAEVGDTLDSITFSVTTDRAEITDGLDASECPGKIESAENEFQYCKITMTITNLTIHGVYEEWDLGNPTLAPNPFFITWTALEESDRTLLFDTDHVYLGVAIDRTQMPTQSTSDAADWLEALGTDIESQNYTESGIELFYFDIVGGTITFLNIFLGLIQAFDYIIMIPIVILSLAVLIYGLVLSLEQRRREIAIHRVIGASSERLRGMILLELAVMSSIAWFAGYLLALNLVPIVLDAVGFMEFRPGEFEVNPTLGWVSTLVTLFATIGLALIFGRGRARRFLDIEIDEGVRKTAMKREPRVWLHWVMFLIGCLALLESWLESSKVMEDGILTNFFIDALVLIFGPFLLWIGGALLLGRLGATGPKVAEFFFGRTKLLKDVRRGLKGSGSAESVNQLAIIMLLTLSIVTLAAVQGYTGTLVDERTASAEVGADLSVTMTGQMNESEMRTFLLGIVSEDSAVEVERNLAITTVPSILVRENGSNDQMQAFVVLNSAEDVLHWDEQAIPGTDIDAWQKKVQDGGFSAGEDAAYDLGLWGSGRRGGDSSDELLKSGDDRSESLDFVYLELSPVESQQEPQYDFEEMLAEYPFENDWHGVDSKDENWSGRDFGLTNMLETTWENVSLVGANLSGSVISNASFKDVDLSGADLTDTIVAFSTFENVTLNGADLTGMFGYVNLSQFNLEGVTCPNGLTSDRTECATSQVPPPLVAPLLGSSTDISFNITRHDFSSQYLGVHFWIPGQSTSTLNPAIIIGESTWRGLVGDQAADNLVSTTWYFDLGGFATQNDGDDLRALRATLEADPMVVSASDWSSAHREVERNGGLIFGTPGLLSMQFVVASVAAVASSFVFLSLVLTQRQKELAILQAIGASPNQIIRLVLFEIIAIVAMSMILGILLGMALAMSFNGFFSIFGFIFQIFGGSSTPIERELMWPWTQLAAVSAAVFGAVLIALLITTRRTLKADLASVLKGE